MVHIAIHTYDYHPRFFSSYGHKVRAEEEAEKHIMPLCGSSKEKDVAPCFKTGGIHACISRMHVLRRVWRLRVKTWLGAPVPARFSSNVDPKWFFRSQYVRMYGVPGPIVTRGLKQFHQSTGLELVEPPLYDENTKASSLLLLILWLSERRRRHVRKERQVNGQREKNTSPVSAPLLYTG
ncbi:conserved hypothetical protein [Coccidioides posadasii str. Silveira]|uniref:Uncharacterized protein n=1 Tax=Coccidioides posadasii (strain RMSCC 757 / Silveira) TaxID=443226 RepID=E9DHG6_COCPS|nr:conserved hypothetical protein [Coccidioides posadasii str. Silveira]